MAKQSTMGGGLLEIKGDAAPMTPAKTGQRWKLTVKIDDDVYERMRQQAHDLRRSHQSLLEDAIKNAFPPE